MFSIARQFLLLLLGLLWSVSLFGQKQGRQKIDSLQAIIPSLRSDTDRINTFAELSFTYFPIDPLVGLSYGEKSLAMARELKYLQGEADAMNALGANYWARHDFLRAQDFYLKALKINTALKNNRKIARDIHNIADVYVEFDLRKALLYFQKALTLYKNTGDQLGILGTQANIADVYTRLKKYEEALSYLQQSVTLAGMLHRERDVAAYKSLMSVIECKTGDFDLALNSAKGALRIFKKIADYNPAKDDIARTLMNIALIYQQNRDFKQGIFYNEIAFREFNKLGGGVNKGYAAECAYNIGRIYMDRGMFSKAVAPLEASAGISKSIKDWVMLSKALKDLSAVQRLMGKPLAALQTFARYSIFKDSAYNTELNKSIALRQMEFDFNQEKDSLNSVNKLQAGKIRFLDQQRTLEKLKAGQLWLKFLVALALLGLVAVYIFYRHRLARVKLNNDLANEKLAKELQAAEYRKNMNQSTLSALISQMNPHFIFNALNTIQSFIYSDEKKLAGEYLGKFADLTRMILDNSRKELISLEEELVLLSLYLDIEKVRFGNDLEVIVRIADDVDPENFFLPPMLIQPFVENAIKHGLMHSARHKVLKISICRSSTDEGLEILIDDNGIGREYSRMLNAGRAGHRSFANDANTKRIDILNDQLRGKKIGLRIIDKKNESAGAEGTSVILSISNSLT